MPPSLLRPGDLPECSSPSVTLLARVRRQVPAEESKLAEKALQALGIALISGRGEDGSDGAANIITVMGSWNLSEAQKIVTSGTGGVIVRGVSLLEFCAVNPGRRDLLTRAETPCILNVALRGEMVCFSGINGPEKAALAFRVEVDELHDSHPILPCLCLISGCRLSPSLVCLTQCVHNTGYGRARESGAQRNGDSRCCQRNYKRKVQIGAETRR